MLSNMAQLTFFITQTLQEYENIVNRIWQAFNIGIQPSFRMPSWDLLLCTSISSEDASPSL